MLNAEICEKSAFLCAAAVGLVATGAGGVALIAGAGVALSLPAIWKSFKERGNADFDKVIRKVAKAVEQDFAEAVAGIGFGAEAQKLASAAMGRVLSKITLDRDMLVKAGRDNAKYADQLVERAALQNAVDYSLETNPLGKAQIEVNRRFLHVALELTFDKLDGEPSFEQQIVPFFQKEVFSRFDKSDEKLDQILSLLTENRKAKAAIEAGVSDMAIIELARRIVKDIDDPKVAFAELENAVAVAIEVQEKGHHGSNLDQFVSDVLARVAELSGKGQLDEAAAAVDTAFAQWQERQARENLAGIEILKSGLLQDQMRRDEKSAAGRLMQIAAIEFPDENERFEHLRGVQDKYYQRGLNRGGMLDLQIVAEQSRLMVHAFNVPAQKGIALNDLAITLSILGERAEGEQGQEYLEQAIKGYDLALEIFEQPGMEYYAEKARKLRQMALDALALLRGDD